MPDRLSLRAGDLTLQLDASAGARVLAATCAERSDTPLLARWWCGYEADGQRWSDAPRQGERSFGLGPARVEEHSTGSATMEVTAQVVSPHLRVVKRFTVYRDLPFIRVRYRFETTGVQGRGPGFSVALPGLSFTGALADPFEQAEDTADDGIDLGGGLVRPAWRAFGDAAHAFGLLVFDADRRAMSRLQLQDRGCAFRPPYYLAYSTNVTTTREVRFGLEHQNFGPVDELDWYVGAFRRETLPDLVRLINGFHARRRPAGVGEAIEYQPGESAWDQATPRALEATGAEGSPVRPPLDTLPAAWPAAVSLRAGGETTRHFLVGAPLKTVRQHTSADGISLSLTGDEQRPGHVRLHVSAAAEASPGCRSFTVPGFSGGLEVVVEVSAGVPLPPEPNGAVIGAAALADQARAAGWIVVDAPDLPGGVALLQRPGGGARPIVVDPGVSGSYDVFAGTARGNGIKFKTASHPYWSYVHAERTEFAERVDIQNWQLVETICRPADGSGEVLLRHATVGPEAPLQLAPHPYLNGFTVLSHLRFAAAAAPAPPPPPAARRRHVVGLADIPDVGNDICADAYHEEAWREIVAQHARAGIDTIYWRVDGQCADFHTKIGTVRYSTPRTHDVYSPRSRCYGRALERLDPLRIAVEEAARCDLTLFGWMRANNYSGNVVSDFFVQHPEWHDARENGADAAQLCFAIPEVRAHKTAILREAVAYGLHGLMIDTLRHPPMVGYHPVVTAAFRERYGQDPPRDRSQTAARGRPELIGEPWERWYRFRAQYFAALIRDLRDGLKKDGHATFPIHVRVAPTRYLHDGADLEALLAEKLIDAVLVARYVADPLEYEPVLALVDGRVPVIAVPDPIRGDPAHLIRDLARDERLGGVGVYESNRMVHTPRFRDTLLEVATRS